MTGVILVVAVPHRTRAPHPPPHPAPYHHYLPRWKRREVLPHHTTTTTPPAPNTLPHPTPTTRHTTPHTTPARYPPPPLPPHPGLDMMVVRLVVMGLIGVCTGGVVAHTSDSAHPGQVHSHTGFYCTAHTCTGSCSPEDPVERPPPPPHRRRGPMFPYSPQSLESVGQCAARLCCAHIIARCIFRLSSFLCARHCQHVHLAPRRDMPA